MKKTYVFLMLVLVFVSACDIEKINDNKCPEYMPPSPDFCINGDIIPGSIDENGCQMPPKCQINDSLFEETSGNLYVKYDNGILNYKITVEKPTPCYKIIKDERIMESYPVQVAVDLTLESSDEMCVQVISEEIVEGTINTGHKPGSFTMRFNDEVVYSTNLR